MVEEVELTDAPHLSGKPSDSDQLSVGTDSRVRATKAPCEKRTGLISAGPVSCVSLASCAWSETTYPAAHLQCRSSVDLGVHGHS